MLRAILGKWVGTNRWLVRTPQRGVPTFYLLFFCLFDIAFSGMAFTTKDAATVAGAFNSTFYQMSGANGHFKNTQTDNGINFWTQAEMIETVIDAYEWTSNSTYLPTITNLLNGFVNNAGTSWTGNIYNDDILWAVMAFARGGVVTGNTNYCNIAKANFDAVYARAWDTTFGGGLWWNTQKPSKNACVNGPGACAAFLLYQIYGDAGYYNKCTNIYYWERSVLFHTNTGSISDKIDATNGVNGGPTTYNQGTFLGAANFLGLNEDAALTARYTMMNMGDTGILPQYAVDNNNSGFNAIFLRWMNRLVREHQLQSLYQPWFQMNAEAAWNLRRASDQLSWCRWLQTTPTTTTLYSWDCISSYSALFAAQPTRGTSTYAVPGNYIGYWPLDETVGTIATNFSGSGNNGFVTNATWNSNGRVGGCLVFNGSSSLVQITNPVRNDFSLAFWVKTTQTGGTPNWYNGKGLVDGDASGAKNDFGAALVGGKFAFGVGNPDTTILSTTSINDGAWHYCVATRQQATGIISVYVDGSLQATSTANRNTLNASARLLFGALASGGGYFNGSLDEIKIFSRALSSNEIYALYSSAIFPPFAAPTNLVATAGNAQAQLSWSDGDGATSYNVKRSPMNGGTYVTITNVAAASFTDTTVTNNRSYYYVVSSVNAQGESANSPQAVASPLALAAWFRADTLNLNDGAPVVQWNDASGNGHQAIQNVTANQPVFAANAINGQPAVHFNSASNSFLWFYRPVQDDFTIMILFQSSQGIGTGTTALANYAGLVSGKNTGINDDFGITLNSGGRIVAGVGNPNTNIYSAQNFNDGNPHIATFTRSESTGVINLYVDGALVMSGIGGTQSLTAPNVLVIGGHPALNNFLTGDIAEVRIYNAVLSAADQAAQENAIRCHYGLSGGSTPATPTALTGAAGNRKISLNWALVSGASAYDLWRSTNNGVSYQLIAGGLTAGSYVDANAVSGRTNYYQVAAVDDCGEGAFSSVAAILLPQPQLELNATASALTIRWPDWADDWTLYTTTNLTPPVLWQSVTNSAGSNDGFFNVTVPMNHAGSQFYQLKSP